MRRSTAGPTEAEIHALLREHGRRWRALAWSLTGQRSDSEDLLQETLTMVVRRWERVQRSRDAGAYVRTMMVRIFLGQRRRLSSREVVSDVLVQARVGGQSDTTDALADRDELLGMVSTLPRGQCAVVVLRYLEELSVEETADALGMSSAAVRTSCSRALATLRAGIAEGATSSRVRSSGSSSTVA